MSGLLHRGSCMRILAEFILGSHIMRLLVIGSVSLAVLALLYDVPAPLQISKWGALAHSFSADPALSTGTITGVAAPEAPALETTDLLEEYNQASTLVEAAGEGQVRYYTRTVGAGSIAYFVVQLDQQVHIEVLNADNALPGSDATGDTIWTDGQRHLQTVEAITNAPYAAREGMALLGAMAFGFHGAERTSDEGTIVINSIVHRVNPGRAALCITPSGEATIGLFNHLEAQNCAQAFGAGPVVLHNGRIANPDVSAETDEFVPFNPLGEDFVQLDWRKMIYRGDYPKSVIGLGTNDRGQYMVMLVSYGIDGVEMARQLVAMGCTDALGGDDDTSTQATWRGKPVVARTVRAVPDAVAVYLRDS